MALKASLASRLRSDVTRLEALYVVALSTMVLLGSTQLSVLPHVCICDS